MMKNYSHKAHIYTRETPSFFKIKIHLYPFKFKNGAVVMKFVQLYSRYLVKY